MTLDSKLYKKSKPQLGLLDFSVARFKNKVQVEALQGEHQAAYRYIKGTDHLLHFQVFKITNGGKPIETLPSKEPLTQKVKGKQSDVDSLPSKGPPSKVKD